MADELKQTQSNTGDEGYLTVEIRGERAGERRPSRGHRDTENVT